jgi:hypothetical protein
MVEDGGVAQAPTWPKRFPTPPPPPALPASTPLIAGTFKLHECPANTECADVEPHSTVVLAAAPLNTRKMTEITRRDFEMTNGRRGEQANGCVVETYKRKTSAVLTRWDLRPEGFVIVWLYRSPDAYDAWVLSLNGDGVKGYTDSNGYMGVPPHRFVVGRRVGPPDVPFCERALREHQRYP